MSESPQTDLPGPGGFLPSRNPLPSPAPSTASSRVAALLPHPRSRPLAPGSRKEDYARDYVARRLLHISRRYVKKFGIPDPADQVSGYESMEEVCRDLEEVVDVLWFSGTPSLQVPYLLNIALAFNTYLPSFPPVPRPTFALLRKLDHCFASLLVGYDVKTKKPLPGFASNVDGKTNMNRFSGTDRVRCKSLADETRMLVAVVMSGENDVVDYEEDEFDERRPARAKTEPRNEPSGEATAKPLNFQQEDENMNMEDMDGVKELDFSSDDEDNKNSNGIISSTRKRKANEITKDVLMTDQLATAKGKENEHRVKVEDDDDDARDLRVKLRDIVPANASPGPSSSPAAKNSKSEESKGQRQFHFALEDDDDDDDSDDGNNNNNNAKGNTESISSLIGAQPLHQSLGSTDDEEVNEGEEDDLGDEDEEDEEEEEMHMNVAKVYEKTLVQLGQTLGESITDD